MAKDNSNSSSNHLCPTSTSKTTSSDRSSVANESPEELRIDAALKKTKPSPSPQVITTPAGTAKGKAELGGSVKKQIKKLRQSNELSEQCEKAKNDGRVPSGSPRQVSHKRGPSFLGRKQESEIR